MTTVELYNPITSQRLSNATTQFTTAWKTSPLYISPDQKWIITMANQNNRVTSTLWGPYPVATIFHRGTGNQMEFPLQSCSGKALKGLTQPSDDVVFYHEEKTNRYYTVLTYRSISTAFLLENTGYVELVSELPQDATLESQALLVLGQEL